MADPAERQIDTELDYVVYDDPNAFHIQIRDAVTGERIEGVTEANAIDGWFYREKRDAAGKPVTERFINDRGAVDYRIPVERVDQAIAIVFTKEAPASLRGQEFRLKPR